MLCPYRCISSKCGGKVKLDMTGKTVVWVLGGPGSGKVTQCIKVAEKYNLVHLSTGDLLQEESLKGGDMADLMKRTMERGELIPDEVVVCVLKDAIKRNLPQAEGFIISGYPRALSQGHQFVNSVANIDLILYIDVSVDTLVYRVRRDPRNTESPLIVEHRVQKFLKNIDAILKQYAIRVFTIDGENTEEEVFADVERVMDRFLVKPDIKGKMLVWMLGGPGAGKGRQCHMMEDRYELVHLSTGDLILKESAEDSIRGRAIKKIMDKGDLIPNDVALFLLKAAMSEHEDAIGFIIDGYPREKYQGIAFEEVIGPVDLIIYLDVTTKTLVFRELLRAEQMGKLATITEACIIQRIKVHNRNTREIINQYPTKLFKVNGEPSPESVFVEIQRILNPFFSGKEVVAPWPSTPPLTLAGAPVIWIIGPPGCGKSVQCHKMVARYRLVHLSSGHLIGDEVKSGSPWAEILNRWMKKGTAIPTDVVVGLLKEAMRKDVQTARGFVIDGFPLEKNQGTEFERTICPVSLIFHIHLPDIVALDRLQNKATSDRADETMESILLRMKTYNENIEEVFQQYGKQVIKINGDTSPNGVFSKIRKILDPILGMVGSTPSRSRIHQKPMIWIIGGPGSGRSTQCDALAAKYGLLWLNTGDLIRNEMEGTSARAKLLKSIVTKGNLVSNDLIFDLLRAAVLKNRSGSSGFLFDGFPRNMKQGNMFETNIGPVTAIFHLVTSQETMFRRLLTRAKLAGEVIDNYDVMRSKVRTYLENINLILKEFATKIVKVNADGTLVDVFEQMRKSLDPIIQNQPYTRWRYA